MAGPIDTMKKSIAALQERGKTYDTNGSGVEENFTRAASIASLWLNRTITPRDVALIMASVKMSRIAVSPNHQDSFVDLINYAAFGAAFSQADVGFDANGLAKSLRDEVDKGTAAGVN
jgi:hypothetical protein